MIYDEAGAEARRHTRRRLRSTTHHAQVFGCIIPAGRSPKLSDRNFNVKSSSVI